MAGVLPINAQLKRIVEREKELKVSLKNLRDNNKGVEETRRKLMKDELEQISKDKLQALVESRQQDLVRRISIFWIIRDSRDTDMVERYKQLLEKLDPDHTLLIMWCFFQRAKEKGVRTPFQDTDHFVFVWPGPRSASFVSKLRTKLSRAVVSPGGTGVFETIRTIVKNAIGFYSPIDLISSELPDEDETIGLTIIEAENPVRMDVVSQSAGLRGCCPEIRDSFQRRAIH
ncbi:hypothetical protein Micbo1qcDRAFT_181191 [Microdochium bolleyi]|uniref:Uncharacterized protein n=1 Tax=Microdochium bolleyi TaxID=196109 RepID=A0A136IJP5_9PEZI|nr:hypothetical protein Micbo1qcDRAFT_181191 [Microdochium bolleyi]